MRGEGGERGREGGRREEEEGGMEGGGKRGKGEGRRGKGEGRRRGEVKETSRLISAGEGLQRSSQERPS